MRNTRLTGQDFTAVVRDRMGYGGELVTPRDWEREVLAEVAYRLLKPAWRVGQYGRYSHDRPTANAASAEPSRSSRSGRTYPARTAE